jgi:hypothetical protein
MTFRGKTNLSVYPSFLALLTPGARPIFGIRRRPANAGIEPTHDGEGNRA